MRQRHLPFPRLGRREGQRGHQYHHPRRSGEVEVEKTDVLHSSCPSAVLQRLGRCVGHEDVRYQRYTTVSTASHKAFHIQKTLANNPASAEPTRSSNITD